MSSFTKWRWHISKLQHLSSFLVFHHVSSCFIVFHRVSSCFNVLQHENGCKITKVGHVKVNSFWHCLRGPTQVGRNPAPKASDRSAAAPSRRRMAWKQNSSGNFWRLLLGVFFCKLMWNFWRKERQKNTDKKITQGGLQCVHVAWIYTFPEPCFSSQLQLRLMKDPWFWTAFQLCSLIMLQRATSWIWSMGAHPTGKSWLPKNGFEIRGTWKL